MTNTTDIYWEVDGTSLQTRAYNIETLGGRSTPPKFRGDDEELPHRPGERWLPKVVDSRTIPLAMWVIGCNPDGSVTRARSDIFDDNLRALRRLFWTPGRQIQLKKRFKVGGVLRSATAMAEYESGLDESMIGRYGGKFIVHLKLADPYFYDDVPLTTTLPTGTTAVTVLGDAPTNNIKLTINGARKTTKVRNNTMGIEVTHNSEILSGGKAELYVGEFRSLSYPPGGAAQRSNGSIIHAGSPQWLALQPGVNSMVVSSATGTGIVSMESRSAWL